MQRLIFAIFFTILLLPSSPYAAQFYRHVPFNLAVDTNDIIVVDYDFSKKNGIACTSDHNKSQINYVYKGRQKSSYLPVILQNSRVPEKKHEELADKAGQYRLLVSSNEASDRKFEISCHYIEKE